MGTGPSSLPSGWSLALDTEYQKRFHNDSIIPSKYYKWHSGGADIGNSFNYVVKRILNDFKKGIIKLDAHLFYPIKESKENQ